MLSLSLRLSLALGTLTECIGFHCKWIICDAHKTQPTQTHQICITPGWYEAMIVEHLPFCRDEDAKLPALSKCTTNLPTSPLQRQM